MTTECCKVTRHIYQALRKNISKRNLFTNLAFHENPTAPLWNMNLHLQNLLEKQGLDEWQKDDDATIPLGQWRTPTTQVANLLILLYSLSTYAK